MNDKEFVLVSQGIEIYRTKSQENAVNMVKEYNDEYFDYRQKCYDNYERPADNYVDLEIEYSNEKEKDKEIERLQKLLDIEKNKREQFDKNNQLLHSIIKEVREYMKSIEYEPDADMYIELGQYKEYKHILEILDKENKD